MGNQLGSSLAFQFCQQFQEFLNSKVLETKDKFAPFGIAVALRQKPKRAEFPTLRI